jgi:hypothetical protein
MKCESHSTISVVSGITLNQAIVLALQALFP